jgi:pimeloyl-ACP methyl ester carboxylesterase
MNDTFEHRYVETNGIRLHVVLAGPADGTPVLLLHGWPEPGTVAQADDGAAPRYRAIAPTCGFNPTAERIASARGEELADQRAARRPLREEGARGTTGVLVAFHFAAMHPDRVDRLVVMNGPHPKPSAAPPALAGPARKSWYTAFQIPFWPERRSRGRASRS